MLSLRLLGRCTVLMGNEHPVDLGSRKAQALFVYLAMTVKPTARDTLAALFWPEMAERAAKNNLRTTLAMLKQQFDTYLHITSATVAFNRQLPYQCDAEILYAHLEAALATKNIAALQTAVTLYEGEFLQGFHLRGAAPFEEWLLQQREQLHLRIVHTLETLTALCIPQQEYAVGLTAARKLLEMEPWSEIAHRRLMILLALSGQRSSALAQYERCRQILADELGVEPMPETIALYQQLQTGTFMAAAVSKGPAPTHHNTSPSRPALPNNLLAPLTNFIGRQEELAFLQARMAGGDCRLLTIFGPGGIGKTALAQAWARRLLAAPEPIFPDGIFFVMLAGIEEVGPDQHAHAASIHAIIVAIAETIGCPLDGNQPVQAQLQAYLQPRRLLLILDNFEQLVECSQEIVNLLTHAPNLTVLITSPRAAEYSWRGNVGVTGPLTDPR